jgi:hypothetical protein
MKKLIIILLFLIPLSCYAYTSTTVTESVSASTYSFFNSSEWEATTGSGIRTFTTGNSVTSPVSFHNFGFSIPSDAIIDNISVSVYTSYNDLAYEEAYISSVDLYYGGSYTGGDTFGTITQTQYFTTSTKTWSGSLSTWDASSTSLTPAIINDSNFGFRLHITNNSVNRIFLYSPSISITYHERHSGVVWFAN